MRRGCGKKAENNSFEKEDLMSTIQQYITEVQRLVTAVEEKQNENIEKAAQLCADALCGEGFIFTFACGFSQQYRSNRRKL